MHLSRIRSVVAGGLVAATLAYGGCSSEKKPGVYDPSTDAATGGRQSTGGTGHAGGAAGVDASVGGSAGNAGQDAGPPPNCGTQTCRGHSQCIQLQCVCNTGYKPGNGTDQSDCVLDTSCINIHPLEDHCRQVVIGAHAVAVFFAVDYCAGTAVLPDQLMQLAGEAGAGGGTGTIADAFKITEDGKPVNLDEGWRGIYPRDVESYLTIAIDISDSISGSEAGLSRLADITTDLEQQLLPNLSKPGEPPVGVSVLVFASNVLELVPFTTDLNAVKTGLDRLKGDISSLTAQVGTSTGLYAATYAAMNATERIRQLRADVTEDGVLTTGTAVIITDGVETATNAVFDANRVANSPINVISVTLATTTQDQGLTSAIGQPGSFLAPTRQDWQTAFSEIATRIDQYPDRAYLLAYCSPTESGTSTVEIGLSHLNANNTAGCTFDAGLFQQTRPIPTCDKTFFDNACQNMACGGFLACGACASASQCCAKGVCSDPSPAALCYGQDELCAPSSPRQYCGSNEMCAPPAEIGAPCSDTIHCEPGVGYCDPAATTNKTCLPTKAAGALCTMAAECASLNCLSANPGKEPAYCQPREAYTFEPCSGTTGISAVCEAGSSCSNGACKGRAAIAFCSANTDCASGICDPTLHLCAQDSTCHWNWASKMGQPPP